MSVAVNKASDGPYIGDGANLLFPITFEWELDSEIVVYVRGDDGDEYVAVQGVDYTVNAGASRVEFSVAPLSTDQITVVRSSDFLQQQKFSAQGRWNPETMGAAIDKLTREVQELSYQVSRAPRAANTGLLRGTAPFMRPDDVLIDEVIVSAPTGTITFGLPISFASYRGLRVELVNGRVDTNAITPIFALRRKSNGIWNSGLSVLNYRYLRTGNNTVYEVEGTGVDLPVTLRTTSYQLHSGGNFSSIIRCHVDMPITHGEVGDKSQISGVVDCYYALSNGLTIGHMRSPFVLMGAGSSEEWDGIRFVASGANWTEGVARLYARCS